jgi:aspartokinase/homoserine dehydrogenase 1
MSSPLPVPPSLRFGEASSSTAGLAEATPRGARLAEATPRGARLAEVTPSGACLAEVTPRGACLAEAKRRRAHKFGGSSLADARCLRHVASLLRDEQLSALAGDGSLSQVVVASAMHKTTDALIALVDAARRASEDPSAHDWQSQLVALRERHLAVASDLDPDDRSRVGAWLAVELATLASQMAALAAGQGDLARVLDRVQGLGEVWSSRLLQCALGGQAEGWAWLDAREVLIVERGDLGVRVDWPRTRERLDRWRHAHPQPNVVVTGFIASDADGRATTLGRNGSDHSGSIFAVLFGAELLDIWTDVDGVLSADPRLVPDAVSVPVMSYEEACELAYFGAKVLHPQTLGPAIQHGLVVRIRNTFEPDRAGTVIGPTPSRPGVPGHALREANREAVLPGRVAVRPDVAKAGPVKGLSLVPELAVLEVSGAGMIGVPGTAERVFSALHAAGVSIVMISQGSSEHSICCVIRDAQAVQAERAVRERFAVELDSGQIQAVRVSSGISVLAAVGDGMAGTPGVAARLFGGLARAQVNIRAIAQGSSERNISVAIASADAARGLRAAHAQFWLSPQTVSIGVVGPGNVGRALLRQLAEAMPRLLRDSNLDLRVRAIADSRSMRLTNGAFELEAMTRPLGDDGDEPADLERFEHHVKAEHLPHALIVDCSASPAIADRYAGWLAAGTHVVTPNKQAVSGSWDRYCAIRHAGQASGARFRYEATVGAGLPIVQTLRSLLDTGDELHAIEGVLSGTLAWLFNSYDGSRPFSALVREAHRLRYTEPDPRDDLSGLDVARKLVILAREAGWPLSLDQVEVESLAPASLCDVSPTAFLAQVEAMDTAMAARLSQAHLEGGHLRYIAHLDREGRATVGLRVLPSTHPCAHTQLTDNLVQFRTRRYADNPLVVQGPGAGPEVTAAGVFGDVLQVALALGARL